MATKRCTVIKADNKSYKEKWQHIVDYRELLFVLVYKDIKVKYAQTLIGITWSFINPIFTIIVLTFVFSKVASVDIGNVPHSLFTLTGMIGWAYFVAVVQTAGNSLVGAQDIIKKIYFPRIFIPLSKAIASLVSLLIMFICLLLLMVYWRIAPSSNILFLPVFIGMAILAGLGVSLWVCALSIRFRDLIFSIPILVRIGMFLTPIAYPASEVPESLSLLYFLNPMAGVCESIRWSILGVQAFSPNIFLSFMIIGLLFFSGLQFFDKVEKNVADLI